MRSRLSVRIKVILANCQRTQEGNDASCIQWGWVLLISTEGVFGYWKSYFKNLFNPADTASIVEAKSGNKGDDLSITLGSMWM